MSFLNFLRLFQAAKEVKMEKRMKTVSKSIDLAVASRSVPELSSSVADPEGTETFGRILSGGTEINVSDPDSNPDPKLDPKKNL